MKQNKLVFKQQFVREERMTNPLTWELDAVIPQVELKRSLLKKGYVVHSVKSVPVIMTYCMAAKANWPLAEREKAQKLIDESPPQKIFLIKPDYRKKK